MNRAVFLGVLSLDDNVSTRKRGNHDTSSTSRRACNRGFEQDRHARHNDANAYDYVPTAATNPGGNPPTSGYLQTAFGATLGLPAVNGNTTHNFFSEPGTGGLSASYGVTERLLNATTGTPETVAIKAGTTTCIAKGTCVTGVPEPRSLGMLGVGLMGLAAAWRRKRSSAV